MVYACNGLLAILWNFQLQLSGFYTCIFRYFYLTTNKFLNQNTDSYLMILDNKYIGIIDFLKNNPNDNCPWICLLMIRGEYQSMGYGKEAYILFEEKLKRQNLDKVRIGILQENTVAKKYWTSVGFKYFGDGQWQGRTIECFEKRLVELM